jgi:hypothetical protein
MLSRFSGRASNSGIADAASSPTTAHDERALYWGKHENRIDCAMGNSAYGDCVVCDGVSVSDFLDEILYDCSVDHKRILREQATKDRAEGAEERITRAKTKRERKGHKRLSAVVAGGHK